MASTPLVHWEEQSVARRPRGAFKALCAAVAVSSGCAVGLCKSCREGGTRAGFVCGTLAVNGLGPTTRAGIDSHTCIPRRKILRSVPSQRTLPGISARTGHSLSSEGSAVFDIVAAACASCSLLQAARSCHRCPGYGQRLTRRIAAPSRPATPTPNSAHVQSRALTIAMRFDELALRSTLASKLLELMPASLLWALQSSVLSPFFAVLFGVLCPRPALIVRALAFGVGALCGAVIGSFFAHTKPEAAFLVILQLFRSKLFDTSIGTEALWQLVDETRRRFGLSSGRPGSESFEDNMLSAIYEALLFALLDVSEHDLVDLFVLKRLRAALDLDSIVLGAAHKRVAQELASRTTSCEDAEIETAVDKLLFFTDRISADELDEARHFEMAQIKKALGVSDRHARERVLSTSRALYKQSLSSAIATVDKQTLEALRTASLALGLPSDQVEVINRDTYKSIVANVFSSRYLSEDSLSALERARMVLELSDRDAVAAFGVVAGPILQRDVECVAGTLRGKGLQAATMTATEAYNIASSFEGRRLELGLSSAAAKKVVAEGFLVALRACYDAALVAAQNRNPSAALEQVDSMVAFAIASEKVVCALCALPVASSEVPEIDTALRLHLGADTVAGRLLYKLVWERSLDSSKSHIATPNEVVRLLDLDEEVIAAARVDVGQPRLQDLLETAVEEFKAGGTPHSANWKHQVKRLSLPTSLVKQNSIRIYERVVDGLVGQIPRAADQEKLEAISAFLDLCDTDVHPIHLKAFSQTFRDSLGEAMGRSGVITPTRREGLAQLRKRLGIAEYDAKQIFYGVVQDRLNEMMQKVQEAWEEVTYSQDDLERVWKDRGRDSGRDLSADGTGGDLGIKERQSLEGIRGYKLMSELVAIVDFYVGNNVMDERPQLGSKYPVLVGEQLESERKEEIYGIYAWNAFTCQDSSIREGWERARMHVGGILGLEEQIQQKVLVRIVSRWANNFVRQKVAEKGKLGPEDVSLLFDWVPGFFGIERVIIENILKDVHKSLLQGEVVRLLNIAQVTPEDLQKLLVDAQAWKLDIKRDLELTQPQLRSLFRAGTLDIVENENLTIEQKMDAIARSQENLGLDEMEVQEELEALLQSRFRGCLTNAVGDILQGKETQAVFELRRLLCLATFAEGSGISLQRHDSWGVAPGMRRRILFTLSNGVAGARTELPPMSEKALARCLSLVE